MKEEIQAETIRKFFGEKLTLVVDTPAASGYSWVAEFDEDKLKLIETKHDYNSERIGGSAKTHYTFEATQPGEYRISLTLKRSWEKESAKRVEYIVIFEQKEDTDK